VWQHVFVDAFNISNDEHPASAWMTRSGLTIFAVRDRRGK
jgi:hypothetical protein